MVLLDTRCRDVARILAEGPKTRREIGTKLHELYRTLRPRGSWVREVLLEKNPLVTKISDDMWDLNELGKALNKLPGELGKPLTEEERVFLLGVLLLDPTQRRLVAELIATGRSLGDKWTIIQTTRVIEKLGIALPRSETS